MHNPNDADSVAFVLEEPDEHTSLPAAIRGARRRAGLSQKEAAKRAGVSERGWQDWELGTTSAIERVPDIEKALGLDAGYFVAQLTTLERLLGFERQLQKIEAGMDDLLREMSAIHVLLSKWIVSD